MCPLWQQGLPILRSRSDKVRQQGIFKFPLSESSYFTVVQLCCLQSAVVLQWYVSYEEVARAGPPGQETYPPSCSGWLWVTSPGTARALATAAQQVNTVTALYDPIERSIYK